ncbi:conserved hypothetical protein [Culex quinquefasciatus]|uniref:Uncharacterized protein n=1 Tax=Culex quinquefasciatus TaxID=7176 RepID=B0WKY3_CULQU|nr:conserved hypothetical protein [Culex quinquefasciatus]|eukprot:XP_001849367.1 conserved hypothetical protein [Culex quinquefasciatus]
MTGKCFVLGITTLALLNAVVPTYQYQLAPGPDPRASRRIQYPSTLQQHQHHQQQPRVFFPLEINVPDVINGILSSFRFIWGRFQSIFGLGSSTEIVGAKDPPAPLTPSPALQAVPLAPDDEEYKSPVKTVSVEVDDPVRHPAMHRKTKIKNRKRTPTTKKKRKKIDLSAQWEMIAMDEGWF